MIASCSHKNEDANAVRKQIPRKRKTSSGKSGFGDLRAGHRSIRATGLITTENEAKLSLKLGV